MWSSTSDQRQKRCVYPVDAEGKRGTTLRRVGRGGNIEVHSYACSEAGFDFAVVNETDVLVEGQRVRIRSVLNAPDVSPHGYRHDVSEQVATDSAPYPIRVDEQVFQFWVAVSTRFGPRVTV